jgi:hypothetical protein
MNTSKIPMAPFENPADLEFQQRQWAFERVAGIALALMVVLAMLGVFGSGPLDAHTVQTSKLKLEYSRFLRREAPNEIRLTIRPDTPDRFTPDGFAISVDRAYLEHNSPESIDPEPASKVLKADQVSFQFDSEGPGPFVITLRLRPTRTGPLAGTVRLESEDAIALSQFVYP